MDTLFSILHVAAAVFLIGPLAILPHSAPALLRAGQGASVVKLAKTVNLFSWLSLLVIVFGFGVMGMSKHGTSFTDTWIWLSLVLYVIALVLIRALVTPAMRRGGQTVEADASAKVSVGAISGGAGIATLLLIAVVVLMVWKP